MPKEIKIIILNNCDDETKQIARLACTEWFNIIDYRNFTLYFTRKSEWGQIVDRLSRYTKPIDLTLRKNIMQKIEDITPHLTRLTNVVSLVIDKIEEERSIHQHEWLRLTSALSNLHTLDVSQQYVIPCEAFFSLKYLTGLCQDYTNINKTTTKPVDSLRQLTNLEKYAVYNFADVPDSFANHTRLTDLSVCEPTPDPTLQNWFMNLTGLKSLYVSDTEHLSLKHLSCLETLALFCCVPLDISSTKLTSLDLYAPNEKYLEKEAHNLYNLQSLEYTITGNDMNTDAEPPAYEWLAHLTALRHLRIEMIQDKGLSYVTASLTSLNMWIGSQVDLGHLTELAELKRLEIYLRSATDVTAVSKMTHLDALKIIFDSNKASPLPFSVSGLSLTWLNLGYCSAEVSHMPNLEELSLKTNSSSKYWGFEELPNLTKFTAWHYPGLDDSKQLDYSYVSKMTALKYLGIYPSENYTFNCKDLLILTALEHLEFCRLDNEDSYEYFSGLTNLTELRIDVGIGSPKMVNLPTSLQDLWLDLSNDPKNSDQEVVDSVERLKAKLPYLYNFNFN